MSNLAKLKKQAAEFEQKRQFDKALAKYRQVLDEIVGDLSEADIALYNRVGDLLLRQGSVTDAVLHYERAVDLYAEGGYSSNAIALCNKILRTAPGRSGVYYKLGRISARKGFISDAKQNFLEYADRMRKTGQLDEAFRALKEFADLCPDQDDIRIMLADQLARDDRKQEAIEQLQLLYEKANSEGRSTEAKAVLDRMRAIDPMVVPSSGTPPSSPAAKGGLELLMPDQGASASARTATPPPAPRYTPHGSNIVVDLAGLPLIHPLGEEPLERPAPDPVEGLEGSATDAEIEPAETPPVAGLETAVFENDDAGDDVAPLTDVEHAAFEHPADDIEPLEDVEALADDDGEAADPSAEIDVPLLLPDEQLVSALADTTPSSSELMPEVVPHEPEELRLEAQAAPFEFQSIGDGSPFETQNAIFTADPGDEFDADAEWMEPEPAEAPQAVATAETMDAGPSLADRVAGLRRRLEDDPGDAELHRELGEVLLESGAREEGLEQLEAAIWEFERVGSYAKAYTVTNEILHVDPDAVRFHQKRVEFAFRSGEKPRLVDAYLGLADSLVRAGEVAKARVVYQRVIDLSPDDARARVAFDTITDPSRPPTPPAARPAKPPAPAREPARAAEPPRAPAGAPAGSVRPASRPTPTTDGFVDLAAWMSEEEAPRSTRMVAEGVAEPDDDAQVDFAEMLERFKEGVAANLDEGDFQSHYDLGIAYREMGLLDEAIAEFQKALRATDERVKTYEALGQCFLEKRQYPVAITLLSRALSDGRHADDTLIGVLYMLGSACEAVGRHPEARTYYERVYAVDIQFRDVSERLAAVEEAAR